jgi:LacI family transcriptional regulator
MTSRHSSATTGDALSGARVTIHDLAAMAGVTAGTVSRAINNRAGVGGATRQRILQLAAEHQFTVNATARQLSTGRAETIGVAFPFHASELVTRSAYPALLGGLGDAAEGAGYDLLLLSVPTAGQVGRVTAAADRRRVDGVVLPAAGRGDPTVRELARLGFPAVVIGHRGRTGGFPWVDASHDAASAELTGAMIAAGRRRLVLLNGPAEISACTLRSKGFWAAVAAAGSVIEDAQEYIVGFDPTQVQARIARVLDEPGRPFPDAIVGGNDTIAAACLEEARARGVSVPEELAVSGFDDRSFTAYTSPPLTTVRMPLHDMGVTAATMLIALIEGKPLERRHVVLPARVIQRASAPPADATAAGAQDDGGHAGRTGRG